MVITTLRIHRVSDTELWLCTSAHHEGLNKTVIQQYKQNVLRYEEGWGSEPQGAMQFDKYRIDGFPA